MGRVLVVGSANTDMVVQVPHLPRPGETVLGGTFAQVPGGKGANQAVAAARLDAEVTLIACVGKDALGDAAVKDWKRLGIDTSHIQCTDHAPTGVALITVDASGENSIAVASGANHYLRPSHLTRSAFAEADVVLLQLEVPLDTVARALELARAEGCRIILNPAPAQPLPSSLLHQVDVLTPNQHEFEHVSGREGLDNAASWRSEKMIPHLIVTCGAQGALWFHEHGMQSVAAHAATAIDTTGAGDVFNGALAAQWAKGVPMAIALAWANAAAGFAVTQPGAQPDRLNVGQVSHMINAAP
ncbi:MAG: ribokinase [Rhodothermales bacterium]